MRQLSRLVRGALWYPEGSNQTLAYQLERHAGRTPEHVFLRFEEERFTYAEANARVNQHAHVYRGLGIDKGDVVALVLHNRPALLWHIFGLHKLGAVAGLINTNLSGEPLAQAVRICAPRRVVVDFELWQAFEQAPSLLAELAQGDPETVLLDVEPGTPVPRSEAALPPRFDEAAERAPRGNPESSSQQRLHDLAAYIYTSGTTGLPKAALVRHDRLYRAGSVWSSLALGLQPQDVLYNCLPLYHSSALMLGTGSVVTAGATMALARKFSRTHFWEDVRTHGATSFLYIGELCRYLVNAPEHPRDREHEVRVITGNGLRPDVWRAFRARFGIRRVREFYGATEGNCVTLNVFNVTGSVGPRLPNMVLARWDQERQDFVRDARGFLVKAGIGEPGMLLGRIRGRTTRFDGYRDEKATASKVLRDAFKPGDAYFNTGDLLRLDARGHLYFVDRVGDTFRFKGENVSTGEVQQVIERCEQVSEAVVYGVPLPGVEGRAGMVALRLREGRAFDAEAFKAHVDAQLPGYARPVFVRLVSAIELTGTFKVRTVELQREGYAPATEDPIYVRDPARDAYLPLDPRLRAQIDAGALRF